MGSMWDLGSGRSGCDLNLPREPYDTGSRSLGSHSALQPTTVLSCRKPEVCLRKLARVTGTESARPGDGDMGTESAQKPQRQHTRDKNVGLRCLQASLLSSFMGRDAG